MRLKIKNYAQRVQVLKQEYLEILSIMPVLPHESPIKKALNLSIQECEEHLKIANEYVAITKQYQARRYDKFIDPTTIPKGPTLIELLLSEAPITDDFLNILSEQVDKLPAANTYGYLATSDHKGTVFFILLYYGRRKDVEHLKVFFRQQNVGSFTAGLQNTFGPEECRKRSAYTFIFVIPNTVPNIKGVRKEEAATIRNLIGDYSKYMSSIRKSNVPNDEYRSLWLAAFTQLIKDFNFTSVSDKSESFLQAHTDVVRLDAELKRMNEMLGNS